MQTNILIRTAIGYTPAAGVMSAVLMAPVLPTAPPAAPYGARPSSITTSGS